MTITDLVEGGFPFFHLGSGRLWRRILNRIRSSGQSEVDAPLAMAYELTLRGLGVALFTPALVERDLSAGRLVQLTMADAEPDVRTIALVRHQRRPALSTAAANFVAVFARRVEGAGRRLLR